MVSVWGKINVALYVSIADSSSEIVMDYTSDYHADGLEMHKDISNLGLRGSEITLSR